MSGVAQDDGKGQISEVCFELLGFEMVSMMDRVVRLGDSAFANAANQTATVNEFEVEQTVIHKLEEIGYRVGMSLVEKHTRDLPRLTDYMEIVKFICKEFWMLLFKKQIDNLKTNHKGTFVLQDSNFKWFARMSASSHPETVKRATPYAAFPCGLIRGALANFGVQCVVTPDITLLPQCSFKIVTTR